MDKIRDRFQRLPVKLTDEELEKKKGELVEWTRVRAENEHQLEAWLAEMREEKKERDAQILAAAGYANRAADIIEAGEERRDVEVSDHFDGGNVVTIRNDTGELVATRPVNEDERQMLLPSSTAGPLCSCKDEEIAEIHCPIHGAQPKESKHEPDPTRSGPVGEPAEEERGDGSPSEDV